MRVWDRVRNPKLPRWVRDDLSTAVGDAPTIQDLAHRVEHLEAVAERLQGVVEHVARALTRVEQTSSSATDLLSRLEAASSSAVDALARLETAQHDDRQILRAVYEDERSNRHRLATYRQTPEYEAAFDEPDPLVSILIPTDDRYELLRDRSLPSVLAQTHRNIEVVVVGDDAPPEIDEVIAAAADPRIRYHNLGPHGIYPENPQQRWLMSGTVPFNAALWSARGRWVSPFSNDDALRPDAVETMLAFVREHRYELAYGQLRTECPDGQVLEDVNRFPPELGHTGMLGGLYHAGLRFFDFDLGAYLFGDPNDWSQLRRMIRAGVRMGFLDHIVCTYYPSWRGLDRSE